MDYFLTDKQEKICAEFAEASVGGLDSLNDKDLISQTKYIIQQAFRKGSLSEYEKGAGKGNPVLHELFNGEVEEECHQKAYHFFNNTPGAKAISFQLESSRKFVCLHVWWQEKEV